MCLLTYTKRRRNVWLWERTKLQNILETGLNFTITSAYTSEFDMLMFESTLSNIWWYRNEHDVHSCSLPLSPLVSSHSLSVSLFVFAPACFLWPNMQISLLPFDVHEFEPRLLRVSMHLCIQSCVSNLSIINQQYPTVFTQPIADSLYGCIYSIIYQWHTHRYNISSCPSIFAYHLWFCEVKGMLLFVLNRECLKVEESYLTSKWIPRAKWKTSPTLAWVNTSAHYSYLETLKHVFTLACLHGDWGVATVSSVLSISQSERTFLPHCIIATLSNHSASYAL